MPDYFNNSRRDYSKFDSMTMEQLEEILRQDAQNLEGDTDINMVMYITEVIRKREEPNPDRKTLEEAFELFETKYMPKAIAIRETIHNAENQEATCSGSDVSVRSESTEDKGKVISMPRRMRRLVSTAAVIVLLIVGSSVTANAMGIDLWKVVVNWTQETFHLSGNQESTPTAPEKDNHQEYSSLQDALDANNISVPLVPTWLPDGYELLDIKVNVSPVQEVFLGIYHNNGKKLKVQITKFMSADPQQIEQSDALIEAYESDGIVYYIFADNQQLRAVWIVEKYECYISGELTIDEMKMIVDSIKE